METHPETSREELMQSWLAERERHKNWVFMLLFNVAQH